MDDETFVRCPPTDEEILDDKSARGGSTNRAFSDSVENLRWDSKVCENTQFRRNDNVDYGNGHLQSTLQLVEHDMESDYKCGYGKCTPNWLQKLHNAKCLVLTLCLCAITQGIIVNGLIPVSISTLEKRFHLSSKETGFLAGMYDIAVLLVLIPLSHFGGRGHKGRYLGWGTVIMGIGAFVFALPQFTTGIYDYGQLALSDTCQIDGNSTIDQCSMATPESGETISQLRFYLYVFLLGQLLHGIGASPLYTLGITYIDENTPQQSSPMYLGVYIGFSTVGPALGFIMGGLLLRIYGDWDKVDLDEVHLKNDDPRWYGSWWIGFVISSVLSLIFSIPMLAFARELPEAKRHRQQDIDQAHQRDSTEGAFSAQAFNGGFKELKLHFIQLLKNPTFTCLMIMQVAETFLLNGFTTFLPKLMENMFSLSASTASMITGAIVVPFGFIGNLLGGYVIRKFRLLCKSTILVALLFQAGASVLVFSLLLDCPQQKFIGVNHPYLDGNVLESNNLRDSCNNDCGCDHYFNPVCNKFENVNYFSSCWAGCKNKTTTSDETSTVWTDCECVRNRVFSSAELTPGAKNATSAYDVVYHGLCEAKCTLMPLFFVLFALEVLLTFSSAMPIQQAELRCVPFHLRTLAISLRWIFARLFGAIPGTIGFGAAIDMTCIFWEENCGQKASCLRYNSKLMAVAILGFALAIKLIVLVSLFFAWKLYVPPPVKELDQALTNVRLPEHGRNKVSPSKI